MHILISGSSGLIGSDLVTALTSAGQRITRLVRRAPEPGRSEVRWDPLAGSLEGSALEGLDAVVHLSGANIAGRWNPRKKALIRESRVRGTSLLCEKLAALGQPPKVLVAASAIGYYGDQGAQVLDEERPAAGDFLGAVCAAWEAAAQPARERGLRVVHLRFGVVLSPRGGALARMLLPFKLGLGGVVGPGTQYLSWIALDDAVGAIQHALASASLQGPANAVAPNPVTNLTFTKTLGKVLGRPTFLPMPVFAAHLAFGEMADALLLSSTRVEPKRLVADGFSFRFPELEGALRHVLGKQEPSSRPANS